MNEADVEEAFGIQAVINTADFRTLLQGGPRESPRSGPILHGALALSSSGKQSSSSILEKAREMALRGLPPGPGDGRPATPGETDRAVATTRLEVEKLLSRARRMHRRLLVHRALHDHDEEDAKKRRAVRLQALVTRRFERERYNLGAAVS
jgi:hypothetical protein